MRELMKWRRRIIFCCWASVLGCFLLLGLAIAAEPRTAYDPPYPIVYRNLVDGEELIYEAGWNGIPAASGLITCRRDPQNAHVYIVSGKAWTWGHVAWLWKMEDSVRGYMDGRSLRPYRYEFTAKENQKRSQVRMDFDFNEGKIEITKQRKGRSKYKEVDLGETFDPVTAVMMLRHVNLSKLKTPQLEVCDGNSIYLVRMIMQGEEEVELGLGRFSAYKLSVDLKKLSNGVTRHKKFNWANIWISSDEYRIPLRIEAKVFIGSVYIELQQENRGLKPLNGD